MATRPNAFLRSLPHVLTASRIALVAFTYTVVPDGPRELFVLLVLLMVVTDMVDGPVARKLGVASRAGANFDSIADFAFYASLPVWGYQYEPAVLRAMLPVFVLVAGLYVAALVAASMKKGEIGFHNRWTRLAGTFGVVFALYLVGWGWNVILAALLAGSVAADLWQRARALLEKPPKARAWV